MAGYENSTDYPLLDPGSGSYYQGTFGGGANSDCMVMKFSNAGVLLWSTHYGGSDDEKFHFIEVDASGNLFVCGFTNSTNFPVLNSTGSYFQGSLSGSSDAVVAKFSNSGIRLWATYFGGSGSDYFRGVATDGSGNVYAAGGTGSTNFPVQNVSGAYFSGALSGTGDATLVKFNNSGGLLWSTYIGGSTLDDFWSIDVDVVVSSPYTV